MKLCGETESDPLFSSPDASHSICRFSRRERINERASLILMSLSYLGVLEELMTAGESTGPELMFVGAIVILIPLIMAVLTLTLKDSINRWLNIILGIVITFIYFGSFIELSTTMPAAHIILLSIAEFVAPALIAWYAWKWPKQEALLVD